ncbi:MAG TPA: phage holin family protein [Caulobacteraceae bacterium]|jgi:putative membrane protein
MVRFILRALVAALGLWVASKLGLVVADGWKPLLIAAVLLGVVNAFVRPIVTLLTLPVTIVTLGLFLLVVNGLMLFVVSFLLKILHIGGFHVGSIVHAVLAVIVIWVVSLVANMFLGDELSNRRPKR